METLARLLEAAKEYPIEITLSSGDRHRIPHPDYIHRHPNQKDFVIYPDKGEYFSVIINPVQVVQLRKIGRKHREVA